MMLVKPKMKMNVMAMIGLLLLVLLPKTMQQPAHHRLRRVVDRINEANGPFIGLVLSTSNDEQRLLDSGHFAIDNTWSFVYIADRKFTIGRFSGVPAIYVVARSPLAYVGVTVQILVDKFKVNAIIDYGSAGSVCDRLNVVISNNFPNSDVAVLSSSAFTGVWNWKNWEKSTVEASDSTSLKFGDYNYPEAGESKLASIVYEDVEQCTPSNSDKRTFWFPADKALYEVASTLKNVALENCIGEFCVLPEPKLVMGVKGSSADVLMSNEAYGEFLNQNPDVSTVDRKSAATASTAIANGVPHIVFRVATNKPGVVRNEDVVMLGHKNILKLVTIFAYRILHQPRVPHHVNYNNYLADIILSK